MSSNYQQKKMMNALGAIDTKGNIVLEQFQDGTALLFQPGNAQPFCVATDYDRATASWSYGKYFSDLGCAYEAADPEIIADASVRWVKEDIREKLKAQGIAPTEFNVQSVIMGDSRLWERPLDRDFRDNDPAVAKLFADTMKQMGMDAMHEDNNLLFSTSDIAKILAFSKMVEQELGKKIEHENDTPEKEQSQEHGQDQERQANARGWSDYPATPEQIDLTATVLAADEGVSIDEIKKDFSENPSIG